MHVLLKFFLSLNKLMVLLTIPSILLGTEIETLPKLDFSEQACIGGNVGLRPYRIGGIRLEHEKLSTGKDVYHNYGHGGAGASLAPATVQQAINLFLKNTPSSSEEIAILGAGYIGLLTADILSSQGFSVTVYASLFPQKGFVFEERRPCITSQVAGGYWMPFGLDVVDRLKHEELQIESWNYYVKCIEERWPGIRFRNAYGFDQFDTFKEYPLASYIVQQMDPHPVQVTVGKMGQVLKAIKFKTISIDGETFLNGVLERLITKENVKIVQRKFNSLTGLKQLKERILFNCLGLFRIPRSL